MGAVPYYGDFPEDATVRMYFNTFSSDDPSASVTITNLADADIKVHKDGSATQIVTDGATVSIDFDSITGNHIVTIDTSAHADYSVGSDYAARMEGTTVDGATINAWVGCFSIENREPHTKTALILTDTEAIIADTEAAVPVLTDTEAILADSEAVLTDSEAILADTNELQGDWTNTGRLDTILDAILTDAEAILVDTSTTLDTVVDSILVDTEAILVDTSTTLDTIVDALLVDTEAIVADTNELQTDWANLGRLDVILDAILVDTETIGTVITDTEAILVDTEANTAVLTDTEAILADTNELQTDWANAGRLDVILDAILVDTESTTVLTDTEAILADTEANAAVLTDTEAILADTEAAATPIARLGRSVGVIQEFTIDNTSFTATTTAAQVDAVDIGSLEATDDHYIGRIIIFTSGPNIMQATDITDYDGTNKRFTYTAVTDTPLDNNTFIVV